MPHTAEELEFWLDKRQKRMSGLKRKKRNQLIFKIATISLCILAVYFTWSPAMTVIHKMSLRVAADVSSSDASGTVFIWTWNTVGKLYNTTFTGVGVWVFNTTPTNATDAPPVPPPAPPKDAPRDTKNGPQNSTDNSTTHGDNTTENSTGRENKKEDAANNTSTGGKNNTEDATNNTTTGGENKKEDAANNSTTGGENETDSPYTVLGVVGDVAVFALSFAGYVCYFVATGG